MVTRAPGPLANRMSMQNMAALQGRHAVTASISKLLVTLNRAKAVQVPAHTQQHLISFARLHLQTKKIKETITAVRVLMLRAQLIIIRGMAIQLAKSA